MRTLVISADDFGFTGSINRGVIEAFERGVVTAASMLVGMPGWHEAVRYARDTSAEFDVGLHLNMTVGSPLTAARSLRDGRTGAFLPVPTFVARALAGRIHADDVYVECLAQAHELAAAGVNVTHVDGHRHLHLLPGAWEGVVRAAVALGGVPVRVSREYDPPEAAPRARLKRAVIDAAATRALRRERPPVAPLHFIGSTLRGDARYFARLRSRIAALPDGRSELMTHPGYASGGLPGGDPYDDGREVELCVLTSPALRDLLASEAIVLDNFRARLTTQARSPLSVA